MRGFINIFINRDEYKEGEDKMVMDLVKKYSPHAFEKCKAAGYPIMLMTTTEEATRTEKVDFDSPYPRKRSTDICIEDIGKESENEETLVALTSKLIKLLEDRLEEDEPKKDKKDK